MAGFMMSHLVCDHCGDPHASEEMHHYESVPWPIDSAWAGESASLCDACNTTLREESA